MDSGATAGSYVVKVNRSEKTRRSWTEREEDVLIQALKEAVTQGWKSDNGFRAGYLGFLEHRLKASFPGTNLRGNPHINSKVHVWKKLYGSLVTILSKSGVGWNDTEKTIEASNDTWDAIVHADHSARSMRHKRWIYYHDWCEIFGNDRATGENAENFVAAVQDILNNNLELPQDVGGGYEDIFPVDEGAGESMSVSVTPSPKPSGNVKSKGKKRKEIDESDDALVAAINKFSDATTKTMNDLIKQLSSEEKISNPQNEVLDAMATLPELTDEEKVVVAELLVDNHNKLSLFLRLGHGGRLYLARRLLSGG